MCETDTYEKTFVIGTDASRRTLTFTVRLTADGVFTMSHDLRRSHRADCVSGGQGCDRILSEIVNWKTPRERVYRMIRVWKRWHLNDLRAGCAHQRRQMWDRRRIKRGPNKGELAGWVRAEKDPEGLLCKPCPTCGYEYGTKWLKEELPAELVEEIRSW